MQFMVDQTRDCFANGLSEEDAAKAIDIGDWAKWPEAERREMNITNLYATYQTESNGAN